MNEISSSVRVESKEKRFFELPRLNKFTQQKDSLTDFSYLSQLRNNLDYGYKKSSVYNKSSYDEGYKSPIHSSKPKIQKPKDHRLFDNVSMSLHQSSLISSHNSSIHMPICKPLTNSNQIIGMSFRGKSIYKSNFGQLSPSKLCNLQKQNPRDHFRPSSFIGDDFVYKSIYNKGYQPTKPSVIRQSLRPKDNDHFFSYNNQKSQSVHTTNKQ